MIHPLELPRSEIRAAHSGEALLHEEQRFRSPLLWVPLLATVFLVLAALGAVWWLQNMKQRATGAAPMSNESLWLFGGAAILLNVGLLALFFVAALIVEVRPGRLLVRFAPFQTRFLEFSLADLGSCAAVTYDPLREYGGWGIRYGRNGKAYTVSGNAGVQLEFENGPKLLIGSQHAPELAGAIERARNL